MKVFKIISAAIISTFAVLYLAFLFVLPNCIDINKFEPDIQKLVQENSGFKIKIQDLKISTGWNLSAGIKAGRIDVFYPNNQKFSQFKNIEVKLSLIPIMFRQIQIDSISIDGVIARLKIEKDGKFYIEQFLKPSENVNPNELPFGLKFSETMPTININRYAISFVNSETSKFYTINGKDFKISDFVLNKKIKVEGLGEILFDKKKQMTYDIKLYSKVLPEFPTPVESNSTQKYFNIIDLFKALQQIDLNTDIKADLKFSGDVKNLKTDGVLNINNLTLKVKGQKLPKGFINMKLKDNKIDINSNINTSLSENILLNGFLNYGPNPYIDMNVKSDKILLTNLFDVISSFFPFWGIKDINGVNANGTLKADFNIKSDFKKINSSGFLKINDANIYYNLYKIAIKNINADIDFSRNQIGIKQSSATINGAPISMTGAIDTNAFANISLKANKLPIKGLLATCGMLQILNENNINSGIITINATIHGKLDKTKPEIDILIENLNLYNKFSKIKISLNKALGKIHFDKNNKISGILNVLSLTAKSSDFGTISLPSVKINFNDKDLNIEKSIMQFNNSKIGFKGKINNYTSNKNNVNIEIYGLILANDIKMLIPREYRKDIIAKGKLPLIANISGNLAEQDINAQLLANNNNYISILSINSLYGKTSLINLSMKMINNSLKINDISLNSLSINRGLTENFKTNLKGAIKIATIKGNINNLQSKYPNLNGINIDIPSLLGFSIPSLKNSQVQLKGNINLNGSSKAPYINGQLSLPLIYIPTMKMNSKNLNIALTKNNININCPNLTVYDSQIGFSSVIDNNFSKGIKIKSVDLNASNINLDTMITALAALPQNSVGQGTDLGVILYNGKANIDNFEMAGLTAGNITSNFVINNNTLKMSNINANAYGGKIVGNASYNLVFGNLSIDIQGRGLSAEPALRGFTNMKNLIHGKLDFDTNNVKLIVGTQNQMMQTLRGQTNFIISDGQMGTLGKLENLLYAQNILSNNILKTSLGGITRAVSIKKTGDFKYIKGKVSFSNGWANIISLQTSGPAMSMYMTGRYNLLNNTVNIITLGRLSNDVVQVLGPIGDFSVNKLLSYIPKVGTITANIINQMTTNPNNENLSMLPNLTPMQVGETKEFKVGINGGIDSTSSIKYFKWLSTPKIEQSFNTYPPSSTNNTSTSIENTVQETTKNVINKFLPITPTNPSTNSQSDSNKNQGFADFINSLPELNTR